MHRPPRRLVPVRLNDVPLELRLHAVDLIAREGGSPELALEAAVRARDPSDTPYFVPEAAVRAHCPTLLLPS